MQGGHLVPLAAAGGDDDDADRGALADLAAQLEPVGLREHQVEQDDVGRLGLQQLERAGAVG
jgi:hypothetical protein